MQSKNDKKIFQIRNLQVSYIGGEIVFYS